MLEFVHEDVLERVPERSVLVHLPERQVFPNSVDLDRFQHQMHGG